MADSFFEKLWKVKDLSPALSRLASGPSPTTLADDSTIDLLTAAAGRTKFFVQHVGDDEDGPVRIAVGRAAQEDDFDIELYPGQSYEELTGERISVYATTATRVTRIAWGS